MHVLEWQPLKLKAVAIFLFWGISGAVNVREKQVLRLI